MTELEFAWRLARQKAIDAENALSMATWVGGYITADHRAKFRQARDEARAECARAYADYYPEIRAHYAEKVDTLL
jgi:hypothetical protein